MYAYVCICMHTRVCAYKFIFYPLAASFTLPFTYIHMYMFVCTLLYVCLCVCMYVYA